MVVNSLWPYIRTTIARTIHLKAEIPQQTIVIDFGSGTRRYFQRNYLWDFQYMRKRVQQDVDNLRSGGFQPVAVYIPRSVEPSERFLHYRESDLKALYQLNSFLRSGDIGRVMHARWRPPLDAASYIAQAFHAASCPIYVSRQATDQEGASLCIKRKAFGVLTDDTDYLMFPKIRRYLHLTSLRTMNGESFVDGIEKSILLRYLKISEDRLPMIVGFLGSDVFKGVTLSDKKYLQYKWKMDWLPEAVAMEINTTSTDILPVESHQAVEYYKPDDYPSVNVSFKDSLIVPIDDPATDQVVTKGVAFDNLERKPCHETLRPLRKAVYARNGLDLVTEYLCYPDVKVDDWANGSIVMVSGDTLPAPLPPEDVEECIRMSCEYLRGAGELSDMHYKALVVQKTHRDAIKPDYFPDVPMIDDLHVASLFLQTVETLYFGCTDRVRPPCWELFDGPLFHYLCQHPESLEDILTPSLDNPSSFDWTEILARS